MAGNPVTPNQYRKALSDLGLTQAGAAELFKISLRTSQGYALGEYPVPEAVAIALRLMIEYGIEPKR